MKPVCFSTKTDLSKHTSNELTQKSTQRIKNENHQKNPRKQFFSPRAPELRSALLLPPPLMFASFLSITVAEGTGTVFTI
jgi:hypothetical protein